jgi:AraC family transcriptional regulator, positive regulator of tynA and feaB
MAIWDIAEQPATEQFEYWHDVICDVFIPMTPRRLEPGNGFGGRVESRPFGSVTRTDVRSEPQRTIHGPREVDQSNGDFYFVNLVLDGRCHMRQNGRESTAAAGQLAVVDTTEPYYLDFDQHWRMMTFRLPHTLLSSRLAHPRQGTVTPMDAYGGLGGVAAAMMRAWWEVDQTPSAHMAGELEQSFAAIVSAAMGSVDRDGSVRDAVRAQILRFVSARLGDPTLSVATVCRRFAISPRSLHNLFAGQENTFAGTVRAMRLERCARLLADPGNELTITEMAHRHGFTDSTTFSRAFRRRFGVAPRDVRAQATD